MPTARQQPRRESKASRHTPDRPKAAASSQRATAPAADKPAEHSTSLHRLIKGWLSGLAGVAGAVQLSIISILLGLQPLPRDVPLFSLVRAHPLAALAVGLTLLLFVAIALVVVYRPERARRAREGSAGSPEERYVKLLAFTTALATASTSTVVAMVGMVLARPAWCPDPLCPPVPEISGSYDANLAVAYTASQSSAFLIAGDPAAYSLGRLPPTRGPGAVVAQATINRPDELNAQPYRVQVRVRNRLHGGPGISIEELAMLVDTATASSNPVRVWMQPAGVEDLQVNPFRVTYQGEGPRQAISSVYIGQVPGAHIRLQPEELDHLTLTVTSTVAVELRFRLQVVYRLLSEQSVQTVTLAQPFAAVFAGPGAWLPYQMSPDGHLLPV